MAKILRTFSDLGLSRVNEPVARALLRAGVSPNAVTIAGTLIVVGAAVGLAGRGHLLAATLVITVASFTDMIDGAMARARGGASRFGALLDSTMDRISDSAVFASVAYFLATTGHRLSAVAALLCLITGQIVSYVKARAEGLGFTANVGIAERAERLIIVGLGGLGYGLGLHVALDAALWLLIALSIVTIGQRIVHVLRQDRAAGAGSGTGGAGRVPNG
jgi:CDP-diacylglycerol--glycerol-3-phosphate 3-phosphatidyltransferase